MSELLSLRGCSIKLVKTVLLSLAAALERLVAKSRVYDKHSKIKNNKILSSHIKTQYLCQIEHDILINLKEKM